MADNVAYGASIFGVAGSYTTPIKVATGQVALGGQASFNLLGGNGLTNYTASIPVPGGARGIIAVFAYNSTSAPPTPGGADAYCTVAASPLGYMDGASATVLAVGSEPISSTYTALNPFISGGALEIGLGGIVLPIYENTSTTVYYTVIYY